jgi:hypothetical protein
MIKFIKNWWNSSKEIPKGKSVNAWLFHPSEDITAYELFRYQFSHPVATYCKDDKEYQEKIDAWYNTLPENCKRHFIPVKQKIFDISQYDECIKYIERSKSLL